VAVCLGVTASGKPCQARASRGKAYCPAHDPSDVGRQRWREQSRRGGRGRRNASVTADPVSGRVDIAALDLTAPSGLQDYLAATLAALAELPVDSKVAHAVAAVVGAQVRLTESVTLEQRVSALEALQRPPVTLQRG